MCEYVFMCVCILNMYIDSNDTRSFREMNFTFYMYIYIYVCVFAYLCLHIYITKELDLNDTRSFGKLDFSLEIDSLRKIKVQNPYL